MFYDVVKHIQDVFAYELLTSKYLGDAIQRTGPGPFSRFDYATNPDRFYDTFSNGEPICL